LVTGSTTQTAVLTFDTFFQGLLLHYLNSRVVGSQQVLDSSCEDKLGSIPKMYILKKKELKLFFLKKKNQIKFYSSDDINSLSTLKLDLLQIFFLYNQNISIRKIQKEYDLNLTKLSNNSILT
jgi:hypothetical protein